MFKAFRFRLPAHRPPVITGMGSLGRETIAPYSQIRQQESLFRNSSRITSRLPLWSYSFTAIARSTKPFDRLRTSSRQSTWNPSARSTPTRSRSAACPSPARPERPTPMPPSSRRSPTRKHITTRAPDDFHRLATLARLAESMIAAEHFAPSEQGFYCAGCPYQTACRAWHRETARIWVPVAA